MNICLDVLYKGAFKKFAKFTEKFLSVFIKVADLKRAILLKRDSKTGIFL